MYIVNIANAIKEMRIKKLKGFICENYYRRIGFPKEKSCYSKISLPTKLIQKIPDATNAKQYYQSYLQRKNTKLVKQLKMITQQLKAFKNSTLLT